MKKIIIGALALLLAGIMCLHILVFGVCAKRVSVSQTHKNFVSYEEQIKEIANKYSLNCEKEKQADEAVKHLEYKLSADNVDISIRFSNNCEKQSGFGFEGFSVEYKANDGATLDMNLFAELVNSFSGKKLSDKFLKDFIESPESKYAASEYGFIKQEGELIDKCIFLNFWADWCMYYHLYENHILYDDCEVISCGGLTKKSTTFARTK